MKASAKQDFELMMLPHLSAAYHFAASIMRHHHDAEDVVQEAYMRAFRARHQFDGHHSAAWLMKIVRNTCMTHLARSNNNKVVYLDAQILKHKSHKYQFEKALESDSPESISIASSESLRIHAAIAKLSLEYREIILLREFQGFSYRQISEVTAVPIGTVMSRLSRARRDLRKLLSPEFKEEKGK